MARDLWLGLCGGQLGQLAPPRPLPLGPRSALSSQTRPPPLPHSVTSWSLGVLSALHWPPICPARSSPLSRYLGEWPSWDPGRVTAGQIDRQMSRVMKEQANWRGLQHRAWGYWCQMELGVSVFPPAPNGPP